MDKQIFELVKSTGGGDYLRDSELLFSKYSEGLGMEDKGTRVRQGGTMIRGK